MNTLAVLVIAGSIVTAQGGVWVPVTPVTMLHPVAEHQYKENPQFVKYDENHMLIDHQYSRVGLPDSSVNFFIPARF